MEDVLDLILDLAGTEWAAAHPYLALSIAVALLIFGLILLKDGEL